MNLTLAWGSPTPYPDCNFKASYRRKGDSDYIVIDTSGNTTSGTTVIPISAPANYEGYIQANCCSDELSAGDPFGVNAYSPFTIQYSIDGTTLTSTVTSPYPNPYITVGSITINFTVSGVPMTTTIMASYPANVTEDITTSTVAANTVIVDYTVNSLSPTFGNGGSLQQFDGERTPSYFQFYWDMNTSGSTSGSTSYNGSPASLPSFTLDAFNVTDLDVDSNVLAGNLIMSWAQGSLYNNGASPYNIITLEVYDPTPTLLGTTIIAPGPLGLRQAAITMNKAAYAISGSTLFTMKALTAADVVIDSHTFYLPTFTF